LVEAAGQLFHSFRNGLDYAFILRAGCGACYRPNHSTDPSARPPAECRSASLWVSTGQAWGWPSSYPSALPCHRWFGGTGFADV